uniref:Uncharacterized protein n=1 Tax=Strongyloides papillosus TaxID=174720 RepID=A0A0N5BKN3_STREA
MAQQLAPQVAADLSAILGYLIAFFIVNLLINLSNVALSALNLYFQHKFAENDKNSGDDNAADVSRAATASRAAVDAASVGHTATASVAGYGYVNRPSGVPVPPPHGYFPFGADVPSQYPVLSPRYPASVVPSYEQSLKDDVTCLPA